MILRGKNIYLRAIEPEDATRLMVWENNPENWRVSGTEAPFSMHGILDYINSIQSFRQSGELRMMICLNAGNKSIGTIDLFEANFKHGRAGIGILIGEKDERKKGYASESLELLIRYTIEILDLHNLTANVLEDNEESIKLFQSFDFELIGTRKEWFYEKGKRYNEHIFQLCLRK